MRSRRASRPTDRWRPHRDETFLGVLWDFPWGHVTRPCIGSTLVRARRGPVCGCGGCAVFSGLRAKLLAIALMWVAVLAVGPVPTAWAAADTATPTRTPTATPSV